MQGKAAPHANSHRTPGQRLQLRFGLLLLVSSSINICIIAPFLMRLLDWHAAEWKIFAIVTPCWLLLLAGIAQAMQRAMPDLANWLDREAAGTATQEDEARAFAGSIDIVREVILNSFLLWPVGAALVAFSMKLFAPGVSWSDVIALCAAGALGGAVSSPTVAFLFKREAEPLRARLARSIADPDLRERLARRLPLVWKLQGTVLLTTVVPIIVMMLVVQRQVGIMAAEFVHAQQREWLDSDEPENLASSLHAPFVSLGGAWWLLDPETGKTLAQSDTARVGDPALAIAGALGATGAGTTRDELYAWQRNGRGDRVIVTMLPRVAVAHLAGVAPEMYGLFVLALAIACAAARIGARDLARGIQALRAEAERIALGDLTRTEIFESEDELGDLARGFDRMRQALRETVRRVSDAADRVDAAAGQLATVGGSVAEGAAEQERGIAQASESTASIRERVTGITGSAQALSASVEESSSSILEMGAAGEELSQTASVLSNRVEEVSSSIEEMIRGVAEMGRHVEGLSDAAVDTQSSISQMAGSMREVDSNASETARLSAQVVAVAEGGREKVQQTIAGMEAIRDATDVAEKVIRGLGERANEIGAIVDVIDDVADETNLLALNAAIIAAQAGEHGRAFSVVADEIKELADRVMASTKEIGSLIRAVQNESVAATAAIERGAESVWSGVERSAEAGESLEAITRTARESGTRIAGIVNAVQEQASAASHVQALMERVRAGVEQLRNAMREQEQGHEVVLRGTTAMRDVSQQVHRTTEEQARGGNQIRAGVEVVRIAVEEIHQALQDQTSACEQAAQFMTGVSERARASHESAGQMERASGELGEAAEAMRSHIRRFQL
jgi:methyl-accepting chemotaxis protein